MGRELMIEIGNIPRDNIPPLGKVIEAHEDDKFALLYRSVLTIRSTEIEKCGLPARHPLGCGTYGSRLRAPHF